MKLIEKIEQHRRDFNGKYECENCGEIEIRNGCYDDRNYHDNISPNWKCKICGKSSNDLGVKNVVATKYADYEVV